MKLPYQIPHLVNQHKLPQFLPMFYEITFQCWRKVYKVEVNSECHKMRE